MCFAFLYEPAPQRGIQFVLPILQKAHHGVVAVNGQQNSLSFAVASMKTGSPVSESLSKTEAILSRT